MPADSSNEAEMMVSGEPLKQCQSPNHAGLTPGSYDELVIHSRGEPPPPLRSSVLSVPGTRVPMAIPDLPVVLGYGGWYRRDDEDWGSTPRSGVVVRWRCGWQSFSVRLDKWN